jgi:hypothetical protein
MATNQLTPPAFTNTKAVREHLETWLGWVNEWHAADAKKRADAYNQRRIEEGLPHFAKADPNRQGSTWYRGRLVLDSGRKYLKISNEWTGQTFAYVRAADGAILRAAGGRPVLNKIRGWIWVEDLTTWIHEYGVRYLPNTGTPCFTMDEEAPQTWPAPGPQPEPTKGWMDQQFEEEDAEADAEDAAEAEWFAGLNAARAEVGLEPHAFLEPTEEPEPEPTRPEDREVTIKLSELMKMESAMTALCAIVSLDHDGPLGGREQGYANSVGECKDTQRWLLEQAREAVKIPTSISRQMRKGWALYSPEPAANVGRAVAVKRHEVAALRSSVNALLGVLAERSGTPTRASEEVFAGVYRTRRLEKGSGAAVGDFMAECRQVMDQTEGILD